MTDDLLTPQETLDFGRALGVIAYLLDPTPDSEFIARRIGYELLHKYRPTPDGEQ